jgi:biopolymer transport protein ExbD
MGASVGKSGIMADMNLTPLIDIVLVVLIIMMVNIPIQIEEVGVKLPNLDPNQPPPPPPVENVEQLVVALYADGSIALNRRLMTPEKLQYELAMRLRPMTEKAVFIDADVTIAYGKVVDLVDLAREAGAEKVGFAKVKVEGPRPATEVDAGAMPRGVHIGSPTAIGSREASDADQALAPIKGNLDGCYGAALGRNPTQSGRVMLRVTVAPDGSLMEIKIPTSNTNDAELDLCIEMAAAGIRFPAITANETAIVQYPILFSPG